MTLAVVWASNVLFMEVVEVSVAETARTMARQDRESFIL